MAENEHSASPLPSERIHRQEMWRDVILPIAGGFVIMVVIMAAVLIPPLLPTPVHVATLSNIMVMVFLLLPSFLCLLGFYLFLTYLVFGLNTFNRVSARQLRRLNRLSQTVTDGTIQATDTINRRTAEARSRTLGIEAAMDEAFQPKQHQHQDEENDTTEDTI